ncbi:MAG: hypothetical protein AAGC47_11895 [Bacteroidota bacterium]
MKNMLLSFTIFFLTGIFIGCSEECDDPDISAINALYFECDQGDDGFTQEGINELFVVRFVPFSEPLVADTVFLNGNFPSGPGRFFINDEFPFINTQSPYFTIYGYQVVDPTTGYVGTIENIELEGEYDGDCGYNNIAKKFTFNTEEVDMGGTQEFYLITP